MAGRASTCGRTTYPILRDVSAHFSVDTLRAHNFHAQMAPRSLISLDRLTSISQLVRDRRDALERGVVDDAERETRRRAGGNTTASRCGLTRRPLPQETQALPLIA